MKKQLCIQAILAAVALVNCTRADIIWPAELAWTAIMKDNAYYYDARGDKNQSALDLIGTADSFSLGYWAMIEDGHITGGTTNDAFTFRLRVGGEGGNHTWQVGLDTDGDPLNVEYMLQLVGSGPPSGRGVELVQTANGGPTLEDISIDKNSAAWTGDTSLYSRWTSIPDSSDYYVDIAVPWDTFTAVTGVTEVEQIRTVLTTSSSHTGIGKGDTPLGLDISAPIRDVLSDNIPEPAVATLLIGSGIGMLIFRRILSRDQTDGESPQQPWYTPNFPQAGT